MPNKDKCHDQVVRALQKDGWSIVQEFGYIRAADFYIYADLKIIKSDQLVYVEIKCFPGHNNTQELYIASGQYMVYRSFMTRLETPAPLYLAIPQQIYDGFGPTILHTIQDNYVRMIVVDLEHEVVRWIK